MFMPDKYKSINIELKSYFLPVVCLRNVMSSGGDWSMAKNVNFAFSVDEIRERKKIRQD